MINGGHGAVLRLESDQFVENVVKYIEINQLSQFKQSKKVKLCKIAYPSRSNHIITEVCTWQAL